MSTASLSAGQQQALESLGRIARRSRGALTVDLDYDRQPGVVYARVYLSLASLASPEQHVVGLEEWEPIDLQIYDDFPDEPPIASSGRDDFPELPPQPKGSGFCVRVSPNDWDPGAGMSGFMQAVIGVYQRIACGTLKGHLQPWRPPDDYLGPGWVVVRTDLSAAERTRLGAFLRWAAGTRVDDNRIDICEWLDYQDTGGPDEDLIGRDLARIRVRAPGAFLVPAVITAKPLALEYCGSWFELLTLVKGQGIAREQFLAHLASATSVNRSRDDQQQAEEEQSGLLLFRVVVDTPSDGVDGAYPYARFAAASLVPGEAIAISSISSKFANDERMRDELLDSIPVSWVQVYDGCPESVWRRAAGRPVEKLAGVRVLVLGCGALGAPIAEHCVRAGAAHLHLVDSAKVNPGILVRQPYEDADIGKPKSDVLARRLGRIRPGTEVIASVKDILSAGLLTAERLAQYDLIIDATANRSVATRIERSRLDTPDGWPTLVTVAISQQATRGVAAVTPRGTVGAGIDLLRRLGLETCDGSALRDVYTAFFPPRAERVNFRPEPGCSDATFVGSATDVSALAAQLLDSALFRSGPLSGAADTAPAQRSLSIVRVGGGDETRPGRVVLDLTPDRVVTDHGHGYQVRLDQKAMASIRRYVSASADSLGHTGGLLLGQFDEACGIAWVSKATGLPPCSKPSPLRFSLDADEVRRALADSRSRTGGMLTLIGYWRTQPGGAVAPSDVDQETMRGLVSSPEWHSAMMLLLILGVPEDGSVGAAWTPDIHAEVFAV